MIGALGYDSALSGYTGPGTTRANEMNSNFRSCFCSATVGVEEMNFWMKYTPDAGKVISP